MKIKSFVLALLALTLSLHAGPHTWSGAVNGNWSNAGNWSAGGVPTIGEASLTMTFPGSATRTVMTNNIGALTVTSMSFSGSNYIVRGASTITFGPALLNLLCSGNSNVIESTLNLPGTFAVSVADNKVMAFHTLTGAGTFIKFGEGAVHLRGGASNPLSGGYIVNVGALELHKGGLATAVSGPLTIVGTTNFGEFASVRMFGPEQIAGNVNVTIHVTGLLNMNGHTNTINNLTVMAGSVFHGGLLRLNGSMTLSAQDNFFPSPDLSPLITGNLEFIGASSTITVSNLVCEVEANIMEFGSTTTINKEGPGTLWLQGGGNNPGHIFVNAGTLRAGQNTSLGTAAGNTTVANGASLILGAGLVTSESLNLSGSGVNNQGALQVFSGFVQCYGNVILTNTAIVRVPAAGELQLQGPIIGPGGLRKMGDGELYLAGLNANTFSGATFVDDGKLTLFKNAGLRAIGNVTVTNGALLALEANDQIDNAGVVSLYTGGSFDMTNRNESIGGLNMGRGVDLNTGTGTLTLLGDVFVGAPYTTSSDTVFIRGFLSLGGGTRRVRAPETSFRFDCIISDGAGVGGLRLEGDSSLYQPGTGFGYGIFHLIKTNTFTGPVVLDLASIRAYTAQSFGAPGGGVICTNRSEIAFWTTNLVVTGETLTSQDYAELLSIGINKWSGPMVVDGSNSLIRLDAFGHTNTLTVEGPISGTGGMILGSTNYFASSWTFRFMQSNSYAGLTEVAVGTLDVRHPQALGTAAGGTLLNEGATLRLELPNGAAITNESLTFAYSGLTGQTNNLILVVGVVSNAWTGPVTLLTPAQVRVENAFGTFVISGPISGPGSLEKQGSGYLVLAGANANTYSGETKVTGGVLRLQKPNGVQATSNLTVHPDARLEWGSSEQIADGATLSLISHAFSGVTNAYLANHGETITDLLLRQSRLDAGTGMLTLLGNVDLTHNSIFDNFNIIYGTMRIGSGTHLIFSAVTNLNVASSSLIVWNSIHETGGSGGITITNCVVTLRGSNSFTGPVVVDDAFLAIGHPNALGSPAQGTLLTNSSGMDLAMPSGSVLAGESLVLAPPAPGALYPPTLSMYGEYTNTWAGPITLLGSNQFLITAGSKLTVDGVVSGPAALFANNAWELVLAGSLPNSFGDLILGDGAFVRLAKPPGVLAFTGDLILMGGQFPSSIPTVILEAPGQFLPQTTARVGLGGPNAVLNLNGHAATLRRLLGFGTVEIGTGLLTISNSVAQYSDFLGTLRSAPGGTLIHKGLGTQRGGTFAMSGAAWLQSGTMYFDSGFIDQGLDISAGAVMDMYSPLALFGSLSGAGKLITSSGIIFVGANNASTTFSGRLEGFGNTNLVKIGTGALTLAGTSTHGGKMAVWNGTLLVNGALPGAVHVEPSFGGVTATLGGTGTLGNVVVTGTGARLAPGATTAVPSYGRLTVDNIAIVDGALYRCEIGGTNSGVNLDQIESKETFTLSGVTLTSGAADFTTFGTGVLSNRYTVVKAFAGVNGTFQGKSEGSFIFPTPGRGLQITYLGGANSRDIVLMDMSAISAGSFSGVQVLTNGTVQIGGQGTPGVTYAVQANADLNTTNWVPIGTATGNFNGAFTFIDTNAPSFPVRFYRCLLP